MTNKDRAEELVYQHFVEIFQSTNKATPPDLKEAMSNRVEKALDEAEKRGMKKAAMIAFDIESSYAPSKKEDNTGCCKCAKSHAKADGAAEVVNAIQKAMEGV